MSWDLLSIIIIVLTASGYLIRKQISHGGLCGKCKEGNCAIRKNAENCSGCLSKELAQKLILQDLPGSSPQSTPAFPEKAQH